VHAENDEIVKAFIREARDQGRTDAGAHCETRPEIAETSSVVKGLEIARSAGVRFHLYHLSCARSVDLAHMYRSQGANVTMESCPHYLLFSQEDMQRLHGRLKINPPVRPPGESEKLWSQIRRGLVDCLSSDHAPWPREQKDRPDIFDNASGAPGVETLLPLLYSEGVARGRVSLSRLVAVLAENPARTFGLYPRKGGLVPGGDADIVVLDPGAMHRIDEADLHSSAGWSPYHGLEVRGRVEATVVRGRVVFRTGSIAGDPGWGRFLQPRIGPGANATD
jgi:allantoinase